MQKVTVTSSKSTPGASLLNERCQACNGINGHHGTCPMLNQADAPVYALSQVLTRGAELLKPLLTDVNVSETVTCSDCGKDVPVLDVFPKQRCLKCHAKRFDSIPLDQHSKPDFVKTIRKEFLQ